MSRPAQLEKQIERVKELQAEMLEGDKPTVEDNQQKETQQEPTPPETVTPTVVNEPPATVSKDEYNKLEQRYRTLQGMHAADVARFRTETASLTAAIQDLEERLLAQEKATTSVVTPVKYVTEDDEREYGDTLDMVRRAAREEAEAIARKQEAAYLERINQLESQLGHVRNTVIPTVEGLTKSQQEQIKAEFWGAIDTQVPDWRTINDNQDFKAWLLAEDPITGSTRQQFLSQARDEYNAPRVIKFFQEWKRLAAGGQTPAPQNNAQSELERMVAPGASKGGSIPTQPEKKQWTRAEVAQFYKDVATGKYAGKDDARKKVQDDIFLAQKEGRLS